MAFLREIQVVNSDDPKRILHYVRQLEEQVRYALQSLDADNILAGAIGEGQLSADIQGRLESTAASAAEAKDLQRSTSQAVTRLQQTSVRKKEGTLAFSVYVGTERPEGTEILWFKPGTYTNGAATCEVKYIKEDSE